MAKKFVTQAKFSEIAGVSAGAICNAMKKKLKPSVFGDRIDVNHPAAQEYITRQDLRRIKVAERKAHEGRNEPIKEVVEKPKKRDRSRERSHVRGTAARREKKKLEVPREINISEEIDFPSEIQDFLDFTLRDLIRKFGTDTRFLDWLNATQKIESINEKRLKNAETKGELISKKLVKKAVIDEFNAAHLRLMKDGAKSIASGVISKNASGSELNEIETYVSDILGSFIKPVKRKINKALKNG